MSGLDLDFERPAALSWDFPRDAAGVSLLVAFGAEHGVNAEAMLAGSGLGADDLNDGEQLVTARQELRVVRNLRAALPEVTGVQLGARYRAETFGVLGFALLSSATLAEAANLALRFLDLSFTFAIPDPHLIGDEVVVEFDDAALPADVRGFLVERDLAAIFAVLNQLHPEGLALARVEFVGAAAGSLGHYEQVLGVQPQFAAPANRLVFAAHLLADRLPGSGGAAHALSEAMCAELVSARRVRTGVAQEVRVLIAQHLSSGAAMAQVAAAIGIGERNLRRKLAAEGTSYQALLDEVREALAVQLLQTGLLSVEDVAQRLGYAEASSFIVAFRRWRGVTPSALPRR